MTLKTWDPKDHDPPKTVRLRVELPTTNPKTLARFLRDCAAERITILDEYIHDESKYNKFTLYLIELVEGRRLFLPCRSEVSFPSKFTTQGE